MSVFVKFDEVEGECSDVNHKGWIDVNTIHWAVLRKVTSASSTRGDRESSTTEITDLEVIRRVDSATPGLFLAACCGRGGDIIIHMGKTGNGSGADVYMEYILKNAVITKYQVDAVAQDQNRPIETLAMSFKDMEVRYTPYDDDGCAQSSVSVGFDTATNMKR